MSIDPQQFGELISDVKHIKSMVEERSVRLDDLEREMKGVKRFQYLLTGAWAGAGAGIGAILQKVIG